MSERAHSAPAADEAAPGATPTLEVRNLEKYFSTGGSIKNLLRSRGEPPVQAVDDVSFTLHENESLGIIGESGCGKSTLLKTLMGLHQPTGGEVYFRGQPMSEFGRRDWREYRRNVQIIFQDPFNSHDPKFTVRETLLEPLQIHGMDDQAERVYEMLERVELSPPEKYLDRFPRQLSGGEKQRVSIARALILEPSVILADEPVSMLDVSTQASILNLLNRLLTETGVGMVYISHDISTISYVSDSVGVMYLGRIVERAPTEAVINEPKHPYTRALIDAIPIPDPHHKRERTTIDGSPRSPKGLGEGCRFRDRCPDRMEVCEQTPADVEVDDGHVAACHLYYDHDDRGIEDPRSGGTDPISSDDVTERGEER
ncbi:ABC transporter ATP-binding protein [Haloarcula marina]|uniref:ABC transporter ATP-binding protein n=1 Tax=Haloarcula marina TaxID=2961574 RepID=UPI0020B63F8F|nr:ABC transporter ATP-binding protein [Halomicroarcula marina]